MIREIWLLRHLKMEFFRLKWISKKMPDVSNKKLPDWVRVDRTTFNQIKDKVKKVKDKNMYVRPNRGFYISADDSYKLIQDMDYIEITHEEALKKINDICSNIEKISKQESFMKTKL